LRKFDHSLKTKEIKILARSERLFQQRNSAKSPPDLADFKGLACWARFSPTPESDLAAN
jgi:hypothetical protein